MGCSRIQPQRDLNRSAERHQLNFLDLLFYIMQQKHRQKAVKSHRVRDTVFLGIQKKGFSEEAMTELSSVGRCSKKNFRQRGEHMQGLCGNRESGEWGTGKADVAGGKNRGSTVWGGEQGQATWSSVRLCVKELCLHSKYSRK